MMMDTGEEEYNGRLYKPLGIIDELELRKVLYRSMGEKKVFVLVDYRWIQRMEEIRAIRVTEEDILYIKAGTDVRWFRANIYEYFYEVQE